MTRDLQQTGRNRDHDEEAYEPPQLRRFRRLVSLLMVVMMIGILGIAVALILKLTQPREASLAEPVIGDIAVPAGTEVLSVSRAGSSLYLLLENTETGERQIEERRASDQSLIGRFRLVQSGDN